MNKKKLKEAVYEIVLLIGVTVLVLCGSYAFIVAGSYVEHVTHIWLYTFAMFLVLPIAAYITVSCYMWLLDQIFLD